MSYDEMTLQRLRDHFYNKRRSYEFIRWRDRSKKGKLFISSSLNDLTVLQAFVRAAVSRSLVWQRRTVEARKRSWISFFLPRKLVDPPKAEVFPAIVAASVKERETLGNSLASTFRTFTLCGFKN